MSRYDTVTDKAAELIGHLGQTVKDVIPNNLGQRAVDLVQTGAVIGAVKGGTRVAGRFVRRNPVVLAAAAAGAGLLWYAAHRRAKKARSGPIDGSARRIEARKHDTDDTANGDNASESSTRASSSRTAPRRARTTNQRRRS